MAMSAFYGESHSTSIGMRYSYSVNNNDPEEFNTDHYLMQTVLDPADKDKITLEIFNEDDKDLYFTLAVSGKPLVDSTNDVDNNIKMQVFYRDLEGNEIDPARIEQGTDFLAEVRISNAGLYNSYRDLALTQIFPSGWEIINKRMYNVPDVISENTYEYRDIRDDRVITYFSLYRRGTVKYTVLLNASYTGRFYMPGPQCEAMYNHDVFARRSGKWIEVVKAE